jgi:hypothetical protein
MRQPTWSTKSSGKPAGVKVSNGKTRSRADRSMSANVRMVLFFCRNAFLHTARRVCVSSCVEPSSFVRRVTSSSSHTWLRRRSLIALYLEYSVHQSSESAAYWIARRLPAAEPTGDVVKKLKPASVPFCAVKAEQSVPVVRLRICALAADGL